MTMIEEREIERQQPYFYWLYRVAGIGNVTIEHLFERVKAPEEIYYAKEEILQQWKQEGILGEKQLYNLKSSRRNYNMYSEYDKLGKMRIQMYPFYHPDYPVRLSAIPDRPGAIFVKGKLPDERKKSLAIIGARSCSAYGKRMAERFAQELALAGIQIISGMARGVDGISQSAALCAGGASFGVLGCGVDICYPIQNRGLYEELEKRGGIISAYLPGTLPKPQYFPPRNRIISGLADALLVIEAREKSGTLITVDMALEQGREVYALPGRVSDAVSDGCNRLIEQGAGIALSPEYLLAELMGNNISKNTENAEARLMEAKLREKEAMLTEEEAEIFRLLDEYPKSISDICQEIKRQSGQSIELPEVMERLIRLCIKGAAAQEGTHYYTRRIEE